MLEKLKYILSLNSSVGNEVVSDTPEVIVFWNTKIKKRQNILPVAQGRPGNTLLTINIHANSATLKTFLSIVNYVTWVCH